MWIGGTDQAVESIFRLPNGFPLSYENWTAGQPNDNGKGQNCLTTKDDGWRDKPCGSLGWTLCSSNTGQLLTRIYTCLTCLLAQVENLLDVRLYY